MAKQNIDTGTAGNPATGDTLRGAMLKVNSNFDELYSLVGSDLDTGLITPTKTNGNLILQPNGTGIIEVDKLSITDSAITSTVTNGDVTITANGTGQIVLGAVTINGTSISSADSTTININDGLVVDGSLTVLNAQIDFTALPTADPNVAGRLFRDGTDLKVSIG